MFQVLKRGYCLLVETGSDIFQGASHAGAIVDILAGGFLEIPQILGVSKLLSVSFVQLPNSSFTSW